MHPVNSFQRNKRLEPHEGLDDYHDETSSFFWNSRAQFMLRNQLTKERNENIAKNVIFFLGDGMSM